MEHILILNIGSSSIKYNLFKGEQTALKGYLERVTDYGKGIKQIIAEINKKGLSVDAIGHRVVHGGTHQESAPLDTKKVKELENISELAPLHNIPEVKGIKICMKLFKVPQVAVFDTAFHQTMPEKAYTYAIPAALAAKYKIKRYGFHGTSHNYVAHEAARLTGKPLEKAKIITCHLGNGCSITAINHGHSIDTSMGFTPLEGLVMGTRSGDIDPAIIPFIQQKEKLSHKQAEEMLNKKSGLLGLCGKKDMRDIHAARATDSKAKLAHDVFCYRLTKYIGAYIAAMNGVDAIVFTGGIGENAWWVREDVLENFSHIGLRLNKKANRNNETKISSFASRVRLFVIPTNEELMMAREVRKTLRDRV
ncbi:acetate kinase [Candidatus Woesearchaeota archaeon]|nr:acetate kinase [Candidatus Woesearchaeota archaeon]